jgi:hypothetical protein
VIFWVGSDPFSTGRPRFGASHVLNAALVVSLVVTGGYSSYSLTSGRLTHVENECVYFQYGVAEVIPFLGRHQSGRFACAPTGRGLAAWQSADAWIDSHLTQKDRILADNASNFAASPFSTRPDLFVVRNDRDWQRITADPRIVTYVITQSITPDGPPTTAATYSSDEGAYLLQLDPVGWHLVRSFAGGLNVVHKPTYVQIWRYLPHAGAPTPVGPESNLR